MWGGLLGAAAGAGLGSLLGGDRKAILGGGLLGGLGGYGAESGMFGAGAKGMLDSAIGSQGGSYVAKNAAGDLVSKTANGSGLLGMGTSGILDTANAFGQVQGGLAQRKMAQAEADYRDRMAALQENEYDRGLAKEAYAQNALTTGFRRSPMSSGLMQSGLDNTFDSSMVGTASNYYTA